MKRKIAAILAADVAEYSRLVSEDEEGTLARLAQYRDVFSDFVSKAGGRVFNTAGDAVLAEFSSAVECMRCAIDIQDSLRTRNMGYAPSKQMLFRIGITIGDVVEREGDLLGDGVNIAARLEGLAEPGGICVSRSIYEQVANKLSVPFDDIGAQEVKNMPQPVHAFRVLLRGEQPRGPSKTALRSRPKPGAGGPLQRISASVALGVVGLLAGLGALGIVLWRELRAPVEVSRLDIPPPEPAKQLPLKIDAPKGPGPAAPPKTEPAKVDPPRLEPPKSEPPKPPSDVVSVEPPKTQPPRAEPPRTIDPPKTVDPPKAAAPDPDATPDPSRDARVSVGPNDPPQPMPKTDGPKSDSPKSDAPKADPPKADPSRTSPPRVAGTDMPRSPGPSSAPGGLAPAQVYANLVKAGVVVANPTTAPEFYFNARHFEARGDVASARTNYEKFADLGADFIDPHIRFAALLRAREGRAGARAFYDKLAAGKGGRVASLIAAMQYDGDERKRRIQEFTAKNNDFAPAQLLLADEFAVERIGSGQTLQEKSREFAALTSFLAAQTQGRLNDFFLDHQTMNDWADRARRRHTVLQNFLRTAQLAPKAQFARSATGWRATLTLPEPALTISWRFGGGEFRPTGLQASADPRTGKPAPNLSFELPADARAGVVQVRYDDAAGRTQGPFNLRFEPVGAAPDPRPGPAPNPAAEPPTGPRAALERTMNAWITFGSNASGRVAYYTSLVTNRCAIDRAELTFDDSPLPVLINLPPCEASPPGQMPPNARPWLVLPPNVKSVSVEVTYLDGKKSGKKRFDLR